MPILLQTQEKIGLNEINRQLYYIAIYDRAKNCLHCKIVNLKNSITIAVYKRLRYDMLDTSLQAI